MVRYATVLSDDPKLFAKVRNALLEDARFVEADSGLHCHGSDSPLTSLYPIENPPGDWEDWPANSPIKNPQSMSALLAVEGESRVDRLVEVPCRQPPLELGGAADLEAARTDT